MSYSEFNEKVTAFPGLAVVDFYSDSCIPCKRMSPILAAIEQEYPKGLFVAKVNIAYEEELVEKYQIRTAPTFLFFKDGKEVERLSGARKKEELVQIIDAIFAERNEA